MSTPAPPASPSTPPDSPGTPRGEATVPRSRSRARLALVALFALFFVPIFVSMYLNIARPDWLPFGTVNHGVLLQPPPQLGPGDVATQTGDTANRVAPLTGHWRWAVLSGNCEAGCEALLASVANARIALGRNIQRVQPALLLSASATDRAMAADTAGAPVMQLEPTAAAALNATIANALAEVGESEDAQAAASETRLLLIDPQGFVVVAYATDSQPEHWLKDVRRLLRISKLDQAN